MSGVVGDEVSRRGEEGARTFGVIDVLITVPSVSDGPYARSHASECPHAPWFLSACVKDRAGGGPWTSSGRVRSTARSVLSGWYREYRA